MTIEYKDSKRIVGLSKSTTVANTKPISSQTTNVIDLAVKPDGTEIYVATEDTGKIITYELATPGDVSTAVYNSSKDYTHSLTNPKGMDWNNDGTKIYLASFNSEAVHTYTVEDAYDLSSDVTSVATNDLSGIDGAQALQWSHDGAYLFQADNSGVIHRYEVSTAFVVSDGTRTSFNPSETTAVTGISFGDNGKEMYIVSHANTGLFKYTLSPAYDLSTATHDSTLTTTDADNQGIATSNGKIYVLGQTTDIVTDYNNDIRPTDIQDNSILVEKDTARRYWFSAGTAISFEDDYTSNSGWTQTGSKVTVNSGKSDWVDANAAATNDSLQQVIKSLGITLSDTAWTADFTYINNGGTVGGYPFVFQSGTGNYDSASNDAITMSEDNPNKIKINTKNGGTYVAGSSTIAVSSGTTYYIRIQRTSATDIKLSAFTDSARTTHTSGSPVTASNAGIANITGLTYVQHQNQTTGGGGTSNFEITDLKIYNNSTSAPTTATWNAPSKTPAEIGDLKVHYDATVGVTASSNSVSAWADQSGNGKTLSSVSNPTRVVAGQNGKDYLDFNSAKSMRATGLSETAPRPFTMVAVINPRNGGSQTIIRWSQSNYLALYQNPANTYYMSGGTELNLTDSTLDGSWNAFFMDFKSNADGGTLQINLDTANAVSGTLGSNGTSGTTATLHVGINADNNNWQGSCRYAEIIIFDKVLTAYEKEQLYGHLKTKWGLP